MPPAPTRDIGRPLTDAPPHPGSHRDTTDDTSPPIEAGSTTGAPRWVKAFGLIAVVVVVLVIVLLLTGGGNHGPGRHTGGDAGGQTAPPVTRSGPAAQTATRHLPAPTRRDAQ